jgi:AcrR family transcriptional regulator
MTDPRDPSRGVSSAPPTAPGAASPKGAQAESADSRGKSADRSRSRLRDDDGRLVRGRKSRARIRAAARELFLEKGFDGATLRAIAARAGMGASSIYRHVQSKEELLIDELADLQEEAWRNFRARDQRDASTRERVHRFLDAQHRLLAEDKDLTIVAMRAMTRPDARVAKHVLALNDRTIGLLIEVFQMGRKHKDLKPELNVMEAARALFHITQGARIPWANGMGNAGSCERSIRAGVDLLFEGLEP